MRFKPAKASHEMIRGRADMPSAPGGGVMSRNIRRMNMNRVTSRALAALLGLVLLTACGARMTAEERLAEAREKLAAGDPGTAVIQLKNVLQDDPSNVEARILLARSALAVGDMDTAAKEFRRALDLGAELDEFRVPYAESLVRAGGVDEALRITAPEEAGADPEVRLWHALALVRDGQLGKAEAMLTELESDSAVGTMAQIGLARIALLEQDFPGALAFLEKAGAEGERRADYWEIRALALMQSGEAAAAADAFRKGDETVRDASGMQRLMFQAGEVEALLASGELEAARARTSALQQRLPEHPVPNYLMSRVELQAGNGAQALAYAQAVLAAQPDSSPGHMMAGAASLSMGQATSAERHLARAVEIDPTNLPARKMLAQLRLGQQSPERALETLAPVMAESRDPGVIALAGIASVRAGDPEAAIEIYRRQLAAQPANDELRSMLAVSLIAAGRIDEALAELGQVSEGDQVAQQRAELIALSAELRGERVDEARTRAGELANAAPGDAGLRNVLGGLFLSAGLLDEAGLWFEEVLRLAPDNTAAKFNLGRIAAQQGRLREARERFEVVVAADPANTAARVALSQVLWAQGERGAAIDVAAAGAEADPADVSVRLLLSAQLLQQRRVGEAVEIAASAVELAPEDARAAAVHGAALLESGAAQAALEALTRAHQLVPSQPQYLVQKARAELATNQVTAARQSLINALALEPGFEPALFALAAVERRRGDFDAARQALRRLENVVAAGDARLELLRGELHLAQGQYQQAESAFTAAMGAGSGRAAAIGRYNARRQGELPDPAAPLEAWLEEQPEDLGVRAVLANHYLSIGAMDEARVEYERLVEAAPDNAMLLNNLAWLYSQQDDPRALAIAERAYEAAPGNAMVADTLGWILHQAGNTTRALDLISKAAADAPDVGEIRYHHAVLLAETGDLEAAAREARAVLANTSAATYHEEAQALLERLQRGD